MSASKYDHANHLVGSALSGINPAQNQPLWNTLQALRSLIGELQVDSSQIEQRLALLEASVLKKAP
jgi:hypothetical protein